MAKVLNPFLSGDARGSVGSMTATRNRSGAVMRQKVSPVQPRTNPQSLIRYRLQGINQNFQSLTVAQITAWNDFGIANPRPDVFGNSIARSGINWYIALNVRLVTAGISEISTPPATANADYTPTMSFQFLSGTGITFTFNPAPTGDQRIWLQWSNNVPLSRNFLSKDTRQRVILSSSDSSPYTAIAVADLVLDTTQRHCTCFAVDASGRATPTERFSIYPVSP